MTRYEIFIQALCDSNISYKETFYPKVMEEFPAFYMVETDTHKYFFSEDKQDLLERYIK